MSAARRKSRATAELPPLVQALLDPRAYPHHPHKIELVQTQMSFVFLTGDLAYKVKKAVDLGYLDYTTLEKRRHFCHQEVALNRRLCPDTYLGVVEVVDEGGQTRVEGKGKVLEYAVKMRQLPRERMLDHLLAQGQATTPMVQRVARVLADFHFRSPTGPEISPFGSLQAIRANTEENFNLTRPYIGRTITPRQYRKLKGYTYQFLRQNQALFQQRVGAGRIRDCHGDLHAAHICLENGLCIYDCIEFNDRFRYGDVASELAFLAMDLDFHGFPGLSRALVEEYISASGDDLLGVLLFYKVYRAYVRGKVEGFTADSPAVPPPEKELALVRARRYFDLAYAYANRTLAITCGLVGTGKTSVALRLGEGLGWEVVSSDLVRKALAGIPPTQHRFEAFDRGIYSPDFSRRTYEEMFRLARNSLLQGYSVILDATFRYPEDREEAARLARELGAGFFILETVCPPELVRARLDERLRGETPSDGRWEIYLKEKETWQEVTEAPPRHHWRIDTSRPLETALKGLLDRLRPRA